MTRTTCFLITFALATLATAIPHIPTARAQDRSAKSEKGTASPAASAPDSGLAIAASGEFNRARGPGASPPNTIPRSKRWQVRWTPADVQEYAHQLDFFKIELAAASEDNSLEYVSNLAKPQPDTRQGTGSTEKRMYMTWNEPSDKLAGFDKEILARAGVSTSNRVLLQFYPGLVEDHLAWLEKENANRNGHTYVEEILKTTFGVRRIRKGYEFFVDDQKFRQAGR